MDFSRILDKHNMDADMLGSLISTLAKNVPLEQICDEYSIDRETLISILDDLEQAVNGAPQSLTEDEDFVSTRHPIPKGYTGFNDDWNIVEDFENKRGDVKGDSEFSAGDKVIVKEPIGDLKYGQVLTVFSTTKDHIIYKQGRKEIAVPKKNVEKMIVERKKFHIPKNITLSEEELVKKYMKYIREGVEHDAVVSGIAYEYKMIPEEVEDKLASILGDDYYRSEKKNSYSKKNRLYEEENNTDNIERVAEDVFIELTKNSDKYQNAYDTLEDAVSAIISLKNLTQIVGEQGAKTIVDIIRKKFVDVDGKYGNVPDDGNFNTEEYQTYEPALESEVGKDISESVKYVFGIPLMWEKTETCYIAKYYDKPLLESKISHLKQTVPSFIDAKTDDTYTYLFFRKRWG